MRDQARFDVDLTDWAAEIRNAPDRVARIAELRGQENQDSGWGRFVTELVPLAMTQLIIDTVTDLVLARLELDVELDAAEVFFAAMEVATRQQGCDDDG